MMTPTDPMTAMIHMTEITIAVKPAVAYMMTLMPGTRATLVITLPALVNEAIDINCIDFTEYSILWAPRGVKILFPSSRRNCIKCSFTRGCQSNRNKVVVGCVYVVQRTGQYAIWVLYVDGD